MKRPAIFVLAACDDGPMLVARTDAQPVGNGNVVGVGACLLQEGSHAQDEIDTLLKLSSARHGQRPGPFLALDVGANIGAHTVPWAKFLTGWGSLLAFEAQERLFYALCGNIALNNLFNARAVWAAVSDQRGFMPGPVIDYARCANFGGVSMLAKHNREQSVINYSAIVPMLSLDSINLPRVDIIKIDVEGMEPQVLTGARATIARDLPIITAEHMVCGSEAVIKALPPDYRVSISGINLLAMHKDDVIWNSIREAA